MQKKIECPFYERKTKSCINRNMTFKSGKKVDCYVPNNQNKCPVFKDWLEKHKKHATSPQNALNDYSTEGLR